MNKKNKLFLIFIILLVILFVIAGGVWYFYHFQKDNNQKNSNLEKIESQYPQFSEEITEVKTADDLMKNDPEKVENYARLGLAWKSLAEQAKNEKLEVYKDFYQEALIVYEKAIELTNRRNALFISNAGNINKLLGNYEKAAEYYEEAVYVSPGTAVYYVNLAELYEYQMKKDKETILEVYDRGIKKLMDPSPLEDRKNSFLERYEK